MADRATNPVLRARLYDVSWLLDRKRGALGTRAVSSYVEIVSKADAGELKWRFPEENEDGGLQHEASTHLRRALQIGRSIGWEKAETVAARLLVAELRKRANGAGTSVPVHWFSRLDLDFGVSDPAEVAAGIDDVLKALQGHENMHAVADLWRLAGRAYHLAKKDDDAYRCKAAAAECLVTEAENTHSALVASHHLSAAIAELHGIPGKKERRTELRHRLIDVQAGISEELSIFSQEVDLREIVENVKKEIKKHGLLDKLLVFATLARSLDPGELVREAVASIREHPLASLFGASHLDREGKVIHRTDGSLLSETGNDSAVTNCAVRGNPAQVDRIRADRSRSQGHNGRALSFGRRVRVAAPAQPIRAS
jgi:nitrogen regulatory protein PII